MSALGTPRPHGLRRLSLDMGRNRDDGPRPRQRGRPRDFSVDCAAAMSAGRSSATCRPRCKKKGKATIRWRPGRGQLRKRGRDRWAVAIEIGDGCPVERITRSRAAIRGNGALASAMGVPCAMTSRCVGSALGAARSAAATRRHAESTDAGWSPSRGAHAKVTWGTWPRLSQLPPVGRGEHRRLRPGSRAGR